MTAIAFANPHKPLLPVSDSGKIDIYIEAVVKAADLWKLTNAEAAKLFDVPIATWNRMKNGSYKGNLDQDKVTRASLMVGLFKGLRTLFNGPLQYGWPKQANANFGGATPVDMMISGGIPAMMVMRQHIDALRSGL